MLENIPTRHLFGFIVYGKPEPKLRARISALCGAFTPKKTRDYENLVAFYFQNECRARAHTPPFPLTGPLAVEITFCLQRPPSAKKRMFPHVRPDLDNLGKSVLDALNGQAWVDDAQIVSLQLQKVYTKNNTPCAKVSLRELSTEEREKNDK